MERLGPRYNALALSLRKQALSKAKDVDRELKRDRTRGPLQGIPYGVKDLLAVKKQPTTWGAKPYAAQVFDYDARVIELLDKVGAILIAKLSMVELAGGGDYRTAAASLTGPGLNPWDRTRWSGGSSSGPGAAVAAGLVTFAIGSETSGSILTPSAFCGLTGLRPTYGLVSRQGAMALSWTLDKLGPMCRSAEDCALVLHAIAGVDTADPGSAGRSFNYTPQYTRAGRADITIGYMPVDFQDGAEPSAQPAFQAAFEVIKSLGVKLKEIQLPDFPYGALVSTIIAGEAGSIFEDFIRSGKVDQLADPHQIAGLKAMLDLPVHRVFARHARTLAGESGVPRSVPELRHGPGADAPGTGEQSRRAAGYAGSADQVARRPDSGREPGGFAGDLPALRIRGRTAGGDFAAGAAVLREPADRDRQSVPETDGLASAASAAKLSA